MTRPPRPERSGAGLGSLFVAPPLTIRGLGLRPVPSVGASDAGRATAARPIGPLSGVEDVPAVRRESEARDLGKIVLRPQPSRRFGLALLDRIQRHAAGPDAGEDATAGAGPVNRPGLPDVEAVGLLPQNLLHFAPGRVADVDEGQRISLIGDDGRHDCPRAGPARDREDLITGVFEDSALLRIGVHDRHLARIAEADDHQLTAMR